MGTREGSNESIGLGLRWPRHGEAMNTERGLQVGIIDHDGTGRGIAQGKGLEDGPVLNGMTVTGAIEDAVETVPEDDE